MQVLLAACAFASMRAHGCQKYAACVGAWAADRIKAWSVPCMHACLSM